MNDIPEEPNVEPIKPDTVLYLCDRRACENCAFVPVSQVRYFGSAFDYADEVREV